MKRLLSVLAVCTAVAVGPAYAQIGKASDGPIDISADRLEVIDQNREALWIGNVEAKQGQNTLRSDRMTVKFTKTQASAQSDTPGEGWGEINTLYATGRVFFITPQEVARGEAGEYQAKDDRIILTGNVVVTRGQNVLKGDKLIVDVATGKSVLESNEKGRKADERVRGVFYPKSGDN